MPETVVVDASAIVDLLLGTPPGAAVADRLRGTALHAPAHADAEILSALGRLHRDGSLPARKVSALLDRLSEAPIERHPLPELLAGAWRRRANLRLVDAVYIELGHRLGVPVITTDAGLAAASSAAEMVAAPA